MKFRLAILIFVLVVFAILVVKSQPAPLALTTAQITRLAASSNAAAITSPPLKTNFPVLISGETNAWYEIQSATNLAGPWHHKYDAQLGGTTSSIPINRPGDPPHEFYRVHFVYTGPPTGGDLTN